MEITVVCVCGCCDVLLAIRSVVSRYENILFITYEKLLYAQTAEMSGLRFQEL